MGQRVGERSLKSGSNPIGSFRYLLYGVNVLLLMSTVILMDWQRRTHQSVTERMEHYHLMTVTSSAVLQKELFEIEDELDARALKIFLPDTAADRKPFLMANSLAGESLYLAELELTKIVDGQGMFADNEFGVLTPRVERQFFDFKATLTAGLYSGSEVELAKSQLTALTLSMEQLHRLHKSELAILTEALPKQDFRRLQVLIVVIVGLLIVSYWATRSILKAHEHTTKSLAESEAKFRAFVDTSSDAIVIVDATGKITRLNEEAESTLGYSPEELVGQDIGILVPKKFSKHVDLVRTFIENPHPRQMAESRDLFATRKDGSELPVEISLNPLQTPEGLVVLVSIRDITKRLYTEEALRVSEEQVHQAQKMEAIGQLAGGVAHDFNNMLQAISGYTAMAVEELDIDNPIYEDLQQVLFAAEKSKTLVRQLLTFSSARPDERKLLSLDETISDLSKLLRRVLGEHIELNKNGHGTRKTLLANKSQIEQVLMNLCINARDSMPHGGKITIETDEVQFDEAYCRENTWAREGEYISLKISDTGKGIPESIRHRVFEPFFTTKERGSGTGLGLATTYAIVTGHDGFLKLDSEPGCGSQFSLFFPSLEPSLYGESSLEVQQGPLEGCETILYAEDEEAVRTLGEQILKSAGYTVLSCADGEEARRVASEHGEAVHMAILDVVMPKVGGKDVFDTIRKSRPSMPVLFTSGYSFDLLNAEILNEDCVALISKPHSPNDLLRAVRQLLDLA